MLSSQDANRPGLALPVRPLAFHGVGGLGPAEGDRQEREQEENGEAERDKILRDGEKIEKENGVENFDQLLGLLSEREEKCNSHYSWKRTAPNHLQN